MKPEYQTIDLPHGYAARIARIARDECAENPFENFDCEPPIAVFSERRIEGYPDPITIGDLLPLVPMACFETVPGIEKLAGLLDVTMQDLMENTPGDLENADMRPEDWRDAALGFHVEAPYGWRSAIEYFGRMESLCGLAGIPCYNGQRNGYCQGDSARVFVAATPAWRELVGAPLESCFDQCKSAADMWAAWAYGDVYGVQAIARPDGTEASEGSCWGFYGTDHEASGLLEHCRAEVESDRAERLRKWKAARIAARKESAEALAMACRDIATV